MAVTKADFNRIWASASPLTPYSFSDANYKKGWNFVGPTPPARQMWDKYMNLADQKMQYLYNNYLPLAGGTMTGNIGGNVISFRIYSAYIDNSGNVTILGGGSSGSDGAWIQIHGKNSGGGAGFFNIVAADGIDTKQLQGRPNGTLTWDGQPIQTSSDRRLKTDFADVPADVLEAWGKVNWQQFKYKEDVAKKGDSCRFHTGLVAQDVQEVCGDKILKYGILCHDVREAVEEEKDEDGNVIKEASEAVDMWTVRYEEALAMEVIYLRNEIKKLREEIKALRTE